MNVTPNHSLSKAGPCTAQGRTTGSQGTKQSAWRAPWLGLQFHQPTQPLPLRPIGSDKNTYREKNNLATDGETLKKTLQN